MEKCSKCEGSGWLWWYELDEYDGPASDPHDCYSDDTRYTCDKCEGVGKMYQIIDEEEISAEEILSIGDGAFTITSGGVDCCASYMTDDTVWYIPKLLIPAHIGNPIHIFDKVVYND